MKYLNVFVLLLVTLGLSPSTHAMRVLNLNQGSAHSLGFKSDVGTVFISDDKVADYQVVNANKVVIFGKNQGNSALIIFDKEGNTLISRQIQVNKSLVNIQQQLQLHFPHAEVSVFNIAEQTVLSGTVSSEREKDQIHQFVGELMAKPATIETFAWEDNSDGSSGEYPLPYLTKRSYPGLVNQIEVNLTRQVNVKLTIAEVSHSFIEQFGIQLGTEGIGAGTFVNALTKFTASDIVTVISAIGDDTVGQVLAEPNLSVISGETASFLVGGELPVVTFIDNTTNVEYKEFGIKLDIAAKVEQDDKIMLALMPEVSALDAQFANDYYNIPALKTRRARTTIELADGQSFMLAGLINTEDKELLRRIPYIGDIPVIGALFRHTLTERSKTELIIVATVNLVQPVMAHEIQIPTIKRTSTLNRFFKIEADDETVPWIDNTLAKGGFKL